MTACERLDVSIDRPAAPPAATTAHEEAVSGSARALLNQAPLQSDLVAPVPYDRDDYSPHGWDDSDNDCQSDRHEVLIAQSQVPVTLSENQCRVETGQWVDPFDGHTYTSASEVTIDHLVALSAAHRAGAWAWDAESKRRFAHDIGFAGSFGVVGASVNQAKADKGPDQWKPPSPAAWCSYATNWIRVKARWDLAFDVNEATALHEMLNTCTTDRIEPVQQAYPSVAPPTVAVTPTPVAVTSIPASMVIGSCDARAELVVLENRGAAPAVLDGWVLHDRNVNHSLPLDGLVVGPGERLTIASGEALFSASNVVVWKPENVWNNSGDTATLVDANQAVVSVYDC